MTDRPTITLDLHTLTLGEVAEAERQSGQSFDRLLRGSAAKMMLALFVHRWRSSGVVPTWRELENLPVSDALSSISLSDSGGPSGTSNG